MDRLIAYLTTRRFSAYISSSAADQAEARVPDGWRVAWPTEARMPAAINQRTLATVSLSASLSWTRV